jgi:hypothetical protein
MKAFAMLTAAVLVVIGIGVGVLSADESPTMVTCNGSFRACDHYVNAFGLGPVAVPTNTALRFDGGYVLIEGGWWAVQFVYHDQLTGQQVTWTIEPRPHFSNCHVALAPRLSGCMEKYNFLTFWLGGAEYAVLGTPWLQPASQWLLGVVRSYRLT